MAPVVMMLTVINTKRSPRLRFSMQYQSRTQRPRALPAPLPTSVGTARYGNQAVHWQSGTIIHLR